jgi:P4 family phage/plasmid primase-like protien
VFDEERIRDRVWLVLEDAMYEKPTQNGLVLVRYSPDKQKVDGVVRALEALVRIEAEEVPLWLDQPDERFPVGETVAFRDRLVNVKTLETMERPARWFDTAILPVAYEPDAPTSRWLQAVDEWSDGDAVWAELLARWMGYCLMGSRKYARWMLMYGKIRGGKGTISSVIRKLVGRDAFMGASLEDLAGGFGMDGLERTKVLSINEVSELDGKSGERVCRVVKNIVGRDPMTVDAKYMRQQRNVIVNAAVIMQSNEIPVLPNKGRGLSGKMLVLPFEVSFEGREDLDLEGELDRELAGIAAWAVAGANRLENSRPGDRWPTPKAAERAVHMYHLQNNPFDSFLEARFVRRKDGFVSNSMVRNQWDAWVKANKIRMHVANNMLPMKLVQGSSWDLRQVRLAESQGHERGIAGLGLRKEYDDEH